MNDNYKNLEKPRKKNFLEKAKKWISKNLRIFKTAKHLKLNLNCNYDDLAKYRNRDTGILYVSFRPFSEKEFSLISNDYIDFFSNIKDTCCLFEHGIYDLDLVPFKRLKVNHLRNYTDIRTILIFSKNSNLLKDKPETEKWELFKLLMDYYDIIALGNFKKNHVLHM